jgi:hypothetical protein
MSMSSMGPVMACALIGVAVLVEGCSEGSTIEGRPSTDVDLDQPVSDLEGWDALLADLDATDGQATLLANWIAVFREGLDLARRADARTEHSSQEASWWQEARRSLGVIVGPDLAPQVETWLRARFEREGEP